MIAVDTNLVVRLLTADDEAQHARAASLFATESIFLPKTVLLETEWVLRRAFRLDSAAVVDALDRLVSLPNVRCEDEPAIHRALGLARGGMDFADALHVVFSRSAQRFASCDAKLVETASAHALPVFAP